MIRPLSRRRLLQAAGLSSGALFLPSLFDDDEARAQSSTPKRLVIFETQHGPVTGRWEFRGQGLTDSAEDEWEISLSDAPQEMFRTQLAPLYEHRGDINILEGLAFTSAMLSAPGNNHVVSNQHRFCGGPGPDGKRTSFDQYIVEAQAVPGRIPYLAYNTGSSDANNGAYYDTSGGQLVTGRMRPGDGYLQRAYERVFGALPDPDPAPEASPTTPLEVSRARRQASSDFLKSQYDQLLPKLGSEDRLKLQRHTEMLVDLGKKVAELGAIECARPEVPTTSASQSSDYANVLLSHFFPTAMACDLTRVAILDHTQLDTDEFGAPSGQDVHQDIAHASRAGAAADDMESYYGLHCQQFADMVAAFKSVPEGNGTMLDNSLLLWMPELANGWHDLNRLMVVTAGGLGGSVSPGRYIKYAETGPNPDPKSGGTGGYGLGPAHNQLFVSIMQAMGVERDSVGTDAGTGAGYGEGQPIEMTGPLRRLAG